MRILAIETSCDETAVAILEASGSIKEGVALTVLGNALISQIDIHKEYGGVFPTVAKREHQKNLVPLTIQALTLAGMHAPATSQVDRGMYEGFLGREKELFESFLAFAESVEQPNIDAIALTAGPGLEPALWVGINYAKALSQLWNIPIIPVNHMEGHVASALLMKEENRYNISPIQFPLLALLISGGHTELVVMKDWLSREIVGETRDDAVGEAFDKAARMMGLSYPGGPALSKLAAEHRSRQEISSVSFPRPMIGDGTCNFSFSGLKTAVLYYLKNIPNATNEQKREVARAFEDAVRDVLISKTKEALELHMPETLVIGGGVAANTEIRRAFETLMRDKYPETAFLVPEKELTGDNAIMIGTAGYLNHLAGKTPRMYPELVARGNWRIDSALQ